MMNDLVTFDLCERNLGTLIFMMEAYKMNPFRAEEGFARMRDNNITGDKLYILWNDCCKKNTSKAIEVICNNDIDSIVTHINYENGRGIPYEND